MRTVGSWYEAKSAIVCREKNVFHLKGSGVVVGPDLACFCVPLKRFIDLINFCFSFSSLILNVPCISESCIEIKIKFSFYFTLLCGASKGFMKVFKA